MMGIFKKKTKAGSFRYYDGKIRLSKDEYFAKLKSQKKKIDRSVNKKNKKIPKTPSRKFITRKVISGSNETTVKQIALNINSSILKNESEIFAAIDSITERLTTLIRSNLKKGNLFTLGYNFTFHWKKGVYENNSTKQQGFRPRTRLTSMLESEINLDLSGLASEILDRFNKYLSTNNCIGISFQTIILEVQYGRSRKVAKKTKSRKSNRK